jgi:DNA-binding NarL/FixJ family response regulator
MKTLNDKTTFIVDDDPFWRALLINVLIELNFSNIVAFSNGEECINNLHQHPHLVFLDYHMESMDGLEVLQKIKEHNPETAVVFCSANQEIAVVVHAMKNGSVDYLVKSDLSDKEKLKQIIRNIGNMPAFAEKVY